MSHIKKSFRHSRVFCAWGSLDDANLSRRQAHVQFSDNSASGEQYSAPTDGSDSHLCLFVGLALKLKTITKTQHAAFNH